MKPGYFPFFSPAVLLVLVTLFPVARAVAGGAATPSEPPVDSRKLIDMVDVAGGTVEIEYMRDKSTHVYTLDDLTSVIVNNAKGSLAQIRTGMKVTDFIERDARTLDRLTVEGASTTPSPVAVPAPVPPPKKK